MAIGQQENKTIGLPQTTKKNRRKRLRLIIPAYPAFNIYSSIAKITTALGPVSIATTVNEIPMWDAEVIDENNFRRGPKDELNRPDHTILQNLRPADVVGIYGGLTSTIPRLFEIASLYKKLGVPIIAGGQHFVKETIEEALKNSIDFIVLGEGEVTIKELIEYFDGQRDKTQLHGVVYIDNGKIIQTEPLPPVEDFDRFPIPDFSLVRGAQISLYPVGRVRGCGMNCEFCTVKGKPRYASPERLMEQFASLYEKLGARNFFIVDDLFGQDRSETLRLCNMLANYQQKMHVHFSITVQIRLDKARDKELLSAMYKAGINTCLLYTSPSPRDS